MDTATPAAVVEAAATRAAAMLGAFHAAHFQDAALRDGVMLSVTGRPDPSNRGRGGSAQHGERAAAALPAAPPREAPAGPSPPSAAPIDEPFRLVMDPAWAARLARRVAIMEERRKRDAKKARRAQATRAKREAAARGVGGDGSGGREADGAR